jgi:hypothetical protein
MNQDINIKEDVWLVEKNIALRTLTIGEGASLAAPEGKTLTMTVDGIGKPIKPGTYKGDIFITVTDRLLMQPRGTIRGGLTKEYRAAILIEDGKYVPEKSVPAIVQGGKVTDKTTTGVTILGCEEQFNGIIVRGDSEYTIDKVRMEFEGDFHDDFFGCSAGIMCIDNAKVTINNSEIKMQSVGRSTFHAGGRSVTTLNNCRLTNESPAYPDDLGGWALGNSGSNRTTQVCDYATIYYNNCFIRSNGWGVIGIDDEISTRVYLKGCTIELTGPRARGYGAFSIGSKCFVCYDNCTVNVQGYPLLIGGSARFKKGSNGEITGGSIITSTLYGVMMFRDDGGELKINKGATLNSASSTFVVKGAHSYLNIDNAVLNPGNGVILQLMDNDDVGHSSFRFIPPVGADLPISGRDLTAANPKEDVFMTVSNMEVKGDFYNSTTNLRANCIEKLPPTRPELDYSDESMTVDMDAQQGVKNLDLKFTNTRVNGVISAASASYRKGVVVIDASNYKELSAIKQTACEPVNNGVIVSFDKDCVWTVAGTSYLTSLTSAVGTVIKAPEGKTLTMTIDGMKTKIAPGTYTGKIVMNVD